MTTTLSTVKINTTGGTQARAGLDDQTVADYIAVLEETQTGDGWPFPAIDVYHDGQNYWLADGFHRLAAAKRAGWFQVQATIHQGDRRDAILHAVGANADHGLRRSNDDKRRAVLRLLNDEEWGKWSDREIARRCKVTHPFVAKIRKETGNVTSERVYTDRHGNETVMDTANIGSKPKLESVPDVPKFERTIAVDAQFIEKTVRASYSAGKVSDGKCAKPFEYDGELYINTGGVSGPGTNQCEAVRLIPVNEFEYAPITYRDACKRADDDETQRRLFYYGVGVSYGGKDYVMVYPGLQFNVKLLQVWEIESLVYEWLQYRTGGNDKAKQFEVTQAIKDGHSDETSSLKGWLNRRDVQYRGRDLKQAQNNVHEQLAEQEATGKRKFPTVDDLIPHIRAWYNAQGENENIDPRRALLDMVTRGGNSPHYSSLTKTLPGPRSRDDTIKAINAVLADVRREQGAKETTVFQPDPLTPAAEITDIISRVEVLTSDKSLPISIVGELATALGPLYAAQKAARELEDAAVSQEVGA